MLRKLPRESRKAGALQKSAKTAPTIKGGCSKEKRVRVHVSREMLKAGVKALYFWIGGEEQERYCGADGEAVRDVFLRMYARFLKDRRRNAPSR